MRLSKRTENLPPNSIEIWNAAQRGPNDRPILTIEADNVLRARLNPDGTRLLVVTWGRSAPREALYCTATGRELLVLPQINYRQHQGEVLGVWSPDGNEYWYGVNPDGKPHGYDFRPLTEPKK